RRRPVLRTLQRRNGVRGWTGDGLRTAALGRVHLARPRLGRGHASGSALCGGRRRHPTRPRAPRLGGRSAGPESRKALRARLGHRLGAVRRRRVTDHIDHRGGTPMRLHVLPPSPGAMKVMALAQHLGLDCEIRIIDLLNGENQKPEFAALNPNKKMPVLEDDGFVLWESNAILQYLASKKPETGLWPTDPKRQADSSRWQLWDMAHWDPSCATLVFEHVVKKLSGQGDPDPAQVAKGEQDFKRYDEVLDGTLK